VSDRRSLLVGLGNPPGEYAGTRHNVGAETVELLAERLAAPLSRNRKVACRVSEVRHAGAHLVLAAPEGYMNLSGRPVRSAADWYRVAVPDVIVCHDDLDLPVGVVRVKRGGGHGGHNGLRDIDRALGSPDYLRVRVGVGRPPGATAARDHVLRRPTGAEREELAVARERAADAMLALVTEGLEVTQNRFHARSEGAEPADDGKD
jgi:peptidyl-tRNA hydrolase, PTH1 family